MKIRTTHPVALVSAALATMLVWSVAQARDTRLKLPIKEAMETVDAKDKLGTDVKFFFGSQATPAVAQKYGTYTSNRKTNFANKSDKEGCEWAFLSAMIALKERALAEGGNAVINIQSYYKKNEFSSETEYECGAGAFVGGVTMRGTVAKL
jgi:hypothetical protein